MDDQILVYDQAARSSFVLAVIITPEKSPKENSTPSPGDQIRAASSVSWMTKAERPAPRNMGTEAGLIHSVGRVKYHT